MRENISKSVIVDGFLMKSVFRTMETWAARWFVGAGEIYAIKNSLVYSYFFAIILSVVLIFISAYKGDPRTKIVVLVSILTPFYYFFLELALRKIMISGDALIIRKFLRKKIIRRQQIRLIRAMRLRGRAFIIVESDGESPVIISNYYERFGALANALILFAGEERVSDEVKGLPELNPVRFSDMASIWVAIGIFILVIIARLFA